MEHLWFNIIKVLFIYLIFCFYFNFYHFIQGGWGCVNCTIPSMCEIGGEFMLWKNPRKKSCEQKILENKLVFNWLFLEKLGWKDFYFFFLKFWINILWNINYLKNYKNFRSKNIIWPLQRYYENCWEKWGSQTTNDHITCRNRYTIPLYSIHE